MSKTEFDLLFFVACLTVFNTFVLLLFCFIVWRIEGISIRLNNAMAEWLSFLEDKLAKIHRDIHNK